MEEALGDPDHSRELGLNGAKESGAKLSHFLRWQAGWLAVRSLLIAVRKNKVQSHFIR